MSELTIELGEMITDGIYDLQDEECIALRKVEQLEKLNERLADENGALKRGRDIQRLKIREQAEELQKQETQINLLTDQIEVMNEDKRSEICFDSGRDERDMVIADVLENEVYVVSSDKLRVDKIINQLRGEKKNEI